MEYTRGALVLFTVFLRAGIIKSGPNTALFFLLLDPKGLFPPYSVPASVDLIPFPSLIYIHFCWLPKVKKARVDIC